MNKLPLARSKDLVIQNLGEEILVYDLNTNRVFNLNETSAIVYNACDGKTTFEELKQKSNFRDEVIFLALDQLKKEELIEVDSSYVSPFAGMSRREVIRKVGFASMIALPVISSLVAPKAANAQSVTCRNTECNLTGNPPVSCDSPCVCSQPTGPGICQF